VCILSSYDIIGKSAYYHYVENEKNKCSLFEKKYYSVVIINYLFVYFLTKFGFLIIKNLVNLLQKALDGI
jgi:hypothetical protein